MQTHPEHRPGAPLPLVEGLLKTMREEGEALARLTALFASHHEALGQRRQDLLEDVTNQTNEVVSTLDRLRQARERQQRLLGRVLQLASEPEAASPSLTDLAAALEAQPGGADLARQLLAQRNVLRDAASRSQGHCAEVEFALHYAMDLGRELVQALQGADPTAPARVYTAKGAPSAPSNQRSFLNTIG